MTMEVKLIAYTQPANGSDVELRDVQELIAYCAKVSNPKGQVNLGTSQRLLEYLVKHKHWSPFEMASATLEVVTTRDIARQFLRHRSFSFQEFSQRYADPRDMENTFVLREARLQDTTNRQNSVDFDNPALSGEWNMRQQAVIDAAKEQARVVLPEGNTVSRLYANGTIRSWIHYVELRSGNGTQKEHMEVARAVGQAVTAIFPMMPGFER